MSAAVVVRRPAAIGTAGAAIDRVVISPDGNMAALVGDDGTIELWNLANGKQVAAARTDIVGKYNPLVFSPEGGILALGSADITVKLYNAESLAVVRTLPIRANKVVSLAFSPDGKILACGDINGKLTLLEVGSGKESATLGGKSGTLHAVAFCPDGAILAYGDWGDIHLWDVAAKKIRHTLKGHRTRVGHIVFSPDGKLIASADAPAGEGKLWDATTGKELPFDQPGWIRQEDCYINEMAFSPDAKSLAVMSWYTVGIWDVATGKMNSAFGSGHRPLDLTLQSIGHSFAPANGYQGSLRAIAYSGDGKLRVLGQYDYEDRISVWTIGGH